MAELNAEHYETHLSLDNQLCFALYSAQLAMGKVYRSFLEQLGVTYPQYLVLLLLWEGDGITVSDIGHRLFLDSATLTPLLKRMQKLGLIERHRSEADQRQVILSLTPAGRKLKEQANKIPGAVMCSTGCSPIEAEKLKASLEKLRQSLAGSVNN